MTQYVHEATVELADGADPSALGGAITVALCGTWDHEPPCRWPHHTDTSAREGGHLVRAVFDVAADEESLVRQQIVAALESGQQAGPDGQVSRWSLRESNS